MKVWHLVLALIVTVAVPFLLRPHESLTAAPDRTLIIITPDNEAIRYEFARGFHDYLLRTRHENVAIDWRTPGGTAEISRYLESEYLAAFQYAWNTKMGHPWNLDIQSAYADPKLKLPADAAQDTPPEAARRAFLSSKVSCGIDLFFGGGSFDFSTQAAKGNLVDCGVLQRHPVWFAPGEIPLTRGGEPYYDPQGRWVGGCLSAFGICYNGDSVQRLGLAHPPLNWADLADPGYLHQIALADPTKSGSITKAFEMIIQQQIHRVAAQSAIPTTPATPEAIAQGWSEALQLLQKIGANARYFTDSATKVPLDVASGDAAAGMCIDFYGRYQSEAVRQPGGTSRLTYFSPPDGTSIGVDPIGLLRGAPHEALAQEFIDYVLSDEGQKLWNWKIGTPGGPEKYQLRRLPIRPGLYAETFRPYRADPDVLPYTPGSQFDYQGAWTGALFRPMGFIIRVMCIDTHDELTAAWQSLIAAGFPPEATAKFSDVSAVSYAYASGEMKKTLGSANKIEEVRLAKDLAAHFREQYREAESLAHAGK